MNEKHRHAMYLSSLVINRGRELHGHLQHAGVRYPVKI